MSGSLSPGIPGARASLLLLVLLTLAVYGNSLSNGFVWDDDFIIVNDPATRELTGAAALLLSPDVVRPYYRPLNRASYLLDYQLFGMRPAGFHAINVLFHLLNVLLVYLLGLRLFRTAGPAVLAAALFAVHPVNSEAVNFISGRNNLLALFFVLTSVLVFDRGLMTGSWTRFAVSGFLWFLGLLSKEPAAVAIVLMAVIAWTSPERKQGMPKRNAAVLLPHLVCAGVYLLLRMVTLGGAVGPGGLVAGLPGRIAGNLYVIPRYLWLVLFPFNLNIMHTVPVPDFGAMPWLLPAWGAIVLTLWLLLRTRSVPVRLALLWFALNFIPIANIVPIPSTPMAERYFYLPAVGLWIIAADRAHALYARFPRGQALAAGAAAVMILLGGLSAIRNRDWKDDIALFKSVVRAEPGSPAGHFNLGGALKDAGDLQGAEREWREALRLDAAHSGAMTQLGALAAVRGDFNGAERWFRSAMDADPGNAMARFNLATVLEKTGRPEQAALQYELFLKNVPLEYREYIPRAEERMARLRKSPEPRGRGPKEPDPVP